MNTKAIIYGTLFISLTLNYFSIPIAAPVYKEAVKKATAAHLMEMASSLHPQKPTYIPPVQQAALDKAEGKVKALPPKLELAQQYPAGNSDIIRDLLEANR